MNSWRQYREGVVYSLSMQIGITGLAGAGKTTVFNVLARSHAQVGSFSAQPHIAVVKVPDDRLERLRDLFNPQKYTPAEVTYVDVAGVVPGSDRDRSAQVFAHLREADVLLQVVKAFDDGAGIAPERDIADLELEFVLADLDIADRRFERLEKEARLGKGTPAEKLAQQRELEALTKIREALQNERPARTIELDAEEKKAVRGYGFLTAKPILVLLNVAEPGPDANALVTKIADQIKWPSTEVLALAGRLEMELMELEAEDAAEFMKELGIEESGLGRVIQSSYGLADQISFFPVGAAEVRAWTIPANLPAQQAAGAIHTDLSRGFIRAEVINWQELLDAGNYAEARKRGQLRSEGKGYIVQDGDILHVLFNV
jgi:GTP-binding protein YchF